MPTELVWNSILWVFVLFAKLGPSRPPQFSFNNLLEPKKIYKFCILLFSSKFNFWISSSHSSVFGWKLINNPRISVSKSTYISLHNFISRTMNIIYILKKRSLSSEFLPEKLYYLFFSLLFSDYIRNINRFLEI